MARTAPASIQDAAAAYAGGRTDEAATMCRRILKKAPRHVDALQLLGTIALRRGDDDEAARCYRRCQQLRPDEPHVHYLLGKIAAVQGRFADAVSLYDKALQLRPGYALAVGWKAYALERLGRCEEAMDLLRPQVDAGAADTTMIEVYASICQSTDRRPEAIDVLRKALIRPNVSAQDRKVLLFRLGHQLDKERQFDEAFGAFTEANRIGAPLFDRRAWTSAVDGLIEWSSAERIQALPVPTGADGRPVFIAGMPRSGTTLVEQIIDAHPQGFGAGELTDLTTLAMEMPMALGTTDPFPACMDAMAIRHVQRWSQQYRVRTRQLANGADRIVNKSLVNYRLLGMIAVLFPDARIIRCRRNPLDTCLSCYMSHLRAETNPFAANMENLVVAWQECERLLDHWAEVLPLPIHDVCYESLVADPQAEIRRIIEFIDLPWDDRCLAFHDSGRAVNTLSYDQVRRPMYTTSVERWKNYATHLEGAQRMLDL